MADVPSKTRTGAQVHLRPELRQAPRGARPGDAAAPRGSTHRAEPDGKPGMAPMRAAASAAPSRAAAPARVPARSGLKYLLAAGLGAVVVLAGGGLAWKARQASPAVAAGTVPRTVPAPPVATTVPAPAHDQAQADSARAPTPAQPEIPVAPAAAAAPTGPDAPIDAAPAADARMAPLPSDAASAAEPSPVAHPQPAAAGLSAQAAAPHRKVDVAAAIANAQAKAERFLSSRSVDASAPAGGEGKQAP
jgi:cytoskeletal protein RodZ